MKFYFDPLPFMVPLSPREIRQIHVLLLSGCQNGIEAYNILVRLEQKGFEVPESLEEFS